MPSEDVSLSEFTMRRLVDLMPAPACGAGALGAQVSRELAANAASLETSLGELRRELAAVPARLGSPRGTAAAELYGRALWAGRNGWTDRARGDVRASLDLNPYNAGAYLALAYLQAQEDSARAMEAWESPLRAAIRFGVLTDMPVAARAALELADRLNVIGSRAAAVDVLRTTSDVVDSVAVALALAELSSDAPLRSRLRARAPRLVSGRQVSGSFVAYRDALRAVLDAARSADVDLSAVTLPPPDALLTRAETTALAVAIERAVGARWVHGPRDLSERQRETEAALRDTRSKLDHHRAQKPAMPRVYEQRLRELEDSERELRDRTEQLVAQGLAEHQSAREHLDVALSDLRAAESLADDVGVVPVGPGLAGLIDRLPQ